MHSMDAKIESGSFMFDLMFYLEFFEYGKLLPEFYEVQGKQV